MQTYVRSYDMSQVSGFNEHAMCQITATDQCTYISNTRSGDRAYI